MARWNVRQTATIDDEIEVEAETAEEAEAAALAQWSFVEASQWKTESVERIDDDDEEDDR
jgi:nicotinate-nucleotide pyrophosphorylase